MTATNDEFETDLLSRLEIEVACSSCNGTYAVPASIVRESQRLLAEGCTGESLYECDASFLATLIEPEAIAALERAWSAFEQSATGHGGLHVTVVASAASRRALERDKQENERGCCEHALGHEVSPRPRPARNG